MKYMNEKHYTYMWSLGDKPEKSYKSDKSKYIKVFEKQELNETNINGINDINELSYNNTYIENPIQPSFTFKRENSKRDKANEMINQRELIGQINMNPFIHNNNSYDKVIEEQDNFLRGRNSNND